MTPQQLAAYNKIITEFNLYYPTVSKQLRLGQAFFNKYNDTIYNSQPNPNLFYEKDNNKVLKIIVNDVQNYIKGVIYTCEDGWYKQQVADEKRMKNEAK